MAAAFTVAQASRSGVSRENWGPLDSRWRWESNDVVCDGTEDGGARADIRNQVIWCAKEGKGQEDKDAVSASNPGLVQQSSPSRSDCGQVRGARGRLG